MFNRNNNNKNIREEEVAKVMTKESNWYVRPDDVKLLKKDGSIEVYAAQIDDVTIIYWHCLQNDQHKVQHVSW